MRIVKAQERDKNDVIKLVKRLYLRSAKQYVSYWMNNSNRLMDNTYISKDGGDVTGYILFQKEKDSIYIADLYVLPKYRGKGIAYKLLKIAAKFQKKHNKKYLRVDVKKENKPAYNLYLKLGFKFWKLKNKNSLKLRK